MAGWRVIGCVGRFGLIVGALWLGLAATAGAADLTSFFDPGRAEAAVAKIFDKANHPTKVLSVQIGVKELTVEVQDPAQPKHIDAWIDQLSDSTVGHWIMPETVSGPRAVDPTLANPDLEANLLALKPSDLALVPDMIAAAIKRAALEDPATEVRLELRRQLHLLPVASSGPPQWDIQVSSGRERATIYADLGGKLTHANLDGTRRAQTLNYLAGGPELDAVVALIADTMGKAQVIRRLIVYDHHLSFTAVNPEHPDRFSGFIAGINGVYRDVDDTIANIGPKTATPPPLFGIAEVDWADLPKLQDAARTRLQLPGGRIGIVSLSRPDTAVGDPVVAWEINVAAPDDQTVTGYVAFDVKGNVLRTKFPPGKGPKLDMLDAANAAPALAAIQGGLGAHAAVVELDFRTSGLLITARDPQKTDAQVVLEYHGENLSRSIMPPLNWPTFGPDWFFDVAAAQPVAAHWTELQKDALARVGLAGGTVERITVSKQKMMLPGNDRVLVEVRVEAGQRGGRVVYDMTGRVVDVIK
jgi:hypothetical protein